MARKTDPKQSAKHGRSVGRPSVYPDPELLAVAIDQYFDTEALPTLAGLAYSLGFSDRQSLVDQEGRGAEFSCVIKRARCRIQAAHEKGLYSPSCVGHIFWLKNHAGYVDAQALNVAGADGGPFGIFLLSKTEAEARLAELRAKQDA